MKRFLVLAVIMVAAMAMTVSAADAGKKMPMGAGIQAGVSLANASGSDATIDGYDKKMKIGLGFGAFINFEVSPQFQIQPEIMYVQKGTKYDSTSSNGKITIKLDYLEIPVLVKFVPTMKGNIQPTIFAGPFIGIRMTAKEKAEDFGNPLKNGEADVKDSFKSSDFGVTFGAGIGAKMAKGEAFLNARYDLGLTNVAKTVLGTNPNVKSSSILVLVGYKFNI